MESLRREKPGQIIEVWLQDEMRFGQKGVLTHGWARRGSRPRAVKQTEYDWAYLFGAVCPRTGESVAMVAPSVSIELMNLHLKWIGEHARAGPGGGAVHVVLMLDRAGWHTSPKVVWPSNITPLFLPPYSPELNGIERLWPRVRVKGLANRALPDGAALDAEGVHAWNRLTIDEIKSTCRTPWLERRC